jgi:ribonuclease HI
MKHTYTHTLTLVCAQQVSNKKMKTPRNFENTKYHESGLFLIHLCDSPFNLLKQRLQHGWQSFACATAAERTSMSGIAKADVPFTMESFSQMDSQMQGFIRYALNGSFYTRDKLIHSGVIDTTVCPWCEAEDSVRHRHWECPHNADLTAQIPPEVRAEIHNLPPCTMNHGWISEPEELVLFRRSLMDLPDRSRVFLPASCDFPVAHLFTDGSGWFPKHRQLRVVTWAVVMANLPEDGFETISQGMVPGILQTVLRAEIFAVISALEWILDQGKPAIIWVDNLQVQRNLENFRLGTVCLGNMDNDHDLWLRAAALCQEAVNSQLLIKIVKVHSHEDGSQYTDPIERWAIAGNDAADQAAQEARSLFHPGFWQLWADKLHGPKTGDPPEK